MWFENELFNTGIDKLHPVSSSEYFEKRTMNFKKSYTQFESNQRTANILPEFRNSKQTSLSLSEF